jgi:hypothetical protein
MTIFWTKDFKSPGASVSPYSGYLVYPFTVKGLKKDYICDLLSTSEWDITPWSNCNSFPRYFTTVSYWARKDLKWL